MGNKKKTDNRTVGGRFEVELAEILDKNGFWAHVMQQNKAGQPADIMAVKGNFKTLIDAKVINSDKGFPFSRIEENQRLAMGKFQKRGGDSCWFAMKMADGSVWFMSLGRLLSFEAKGMKQLSCAEIREKGLNLEKWLKETEVWSKDV